MQTASVIQKLVLVASGSAISAKLSDMAYLEMSLGWLQMKVLSVIYSLILSVQAGRSRPPNFSTSLKVTSAANASSSP